MSKSNSTREDFCRRVRHGISSQMHVAIYNVALFTAAFAGMDNNAYYRNRDLEMAALSNCWNFFRES